MNKRLSNVDNASMSSNFLYDNVLPFQVNKVNLAIRGLHVYITLSNKPLCYITCHYSWDLSFTKKYQEELKEMRPPLLST